MESLQLIDTQDITSDIEVELRSFVVSAAGAERPSNKKNNDSDEDWQERALCTSTDPEAFFPEKGGSAHEAKKVCVDCEVRAECLEYALARRERFGIWGGLSERERRKLQKRAV